ncbi:PorV/PorQ family protein [Daejeonella oryzae]|uniref:hypothetical protein n=1 Tax=Daejeonella oryzae TaxID=1122943 RepID=UPI00042499C6|nr:hypothetical protein [Daejeonella oryzae]
MKFLIGLIFLISLKVQAQLSPGPRFTSMALTGVSLQDIWSLQQNQAGIANSKKAAFAIAYEKTFADQELSTQSALLIYPVKAGALGISFQKYGFSAYNTLQTGITYARTFGPNFSAALNFNYHQLRILGYGSSSAFSAAAGIQYLLSENIRIGAHISNPGKGNFGKNINATIPVQMQLGVSYISSSKVIIAGTIEQLLHSEMDLKMGLEYNLINWFAIRAGVSANPFKQYGGFGLNYRKFKLDVAATSQPITGYSPQLALGYEF